MESIRKLNVIFDSGSSWLWVPGVGCDGCAEAGVHCTECTCSEEEVRIQYSIGEIRGVVCSGYFSLEDVGFSRMSFLLVNWVRGMEGA
jgi:hypothetical protein